jgi:pyruvate/2-oxoacid:ferredoxin oxidoreductase beta subunit
MTGGQCSPTTPHDAYATTAPYGNIEPDFNICNLAMVQELLLLLEPLLSMFRKCNL